MELVSADNGFTFVWKIYNVSHCTQKTGECLSSPTFLFINYCKWYMNLYPRGNEETSDYIGIRLAKSPFDSPLKVSVVFSISTDMGSFEKSKCLCYSFPVDNRTFRYTYTTELFLKVPAIHKRAIMSCNADTLTVECKIIKVNDVPINYQKICNAYTVIDVKKNTYCWNVKTVSEKKEIKFDTKDLNLFENSPFTIAISSLKGYSDETFEIVIKQTKAKELNFSSCTLSLLDKEKVLQSIRNEHWFEKSEIEQVWTVSFTPMRKLMSGPQQDKFLLFEFGVSKGVQSSGIEKMEHGPIIQRKISLNRPVVCKPPTEDSRSWKDNLQRFYSDGDGTLSDVTIRTPTKDFPVHKAMLCAQSVVFTAMFERDMKENKTGIIDIDDLEEDTVSKMLIYIYSGAVENLDWDSALKLYFAADKYRIEALGKQCSDFLKENLTLQNVCECLILADLHQDQHLKSVAQEFVMEHSADIINSEVWKELMKENISLAAETMHLCFRNLKT